MFLVVFLVSFLSLLAGYGLWHVIAAGVNRVYAVKRDEIKPREGGNMIGSFNRPGIN